MSSCAISSEMSPKWQRSWWPSSASISNLCLERLNSWQMSMWPPSTLRMRTHCTWLNLICLSRFARCTARRNAMSTLNSGSSLSSSASLIYAHRPHKAWKMINTKFWTKYASPSSMNFSLEKYNLVSSSLSGIGSSAAPCSIWYKSLICWQMSSWFRLFVTSSSGSHQTNNKIHLQQRQRALT